MNITLDNNDLTAIVQKNVAAMGFDGKLIEVKFVAKKGAGAEAVVTISDIPEPVSQDSTPNVK